MITTQGITTLTTLSKDLIADQTWYGLNVLLNTAGVAFDVANGLGQASNTSSFVTLGFGGFDAQKITGVLTYPAPTTQGSEDLGVVLGVLTLHSGNESYLYARVNAGFARITQVLDGTFLTLASTAWAVAQDVPITISFQRVGRLLSANFSAQSGPAPVNLTYTLAADSPLLGGGLVGFRSLSKAVWCRSLVAEQLA